MMWQVYAKYAGKWLRVGEPMLQEEADTIVAQMWAPILEHQRNYKRTKKKSTVPYAEPHCVPL